MSGSLRRGAFTLIELLVVIAIISILASMLLPALAAAKEKARASHCISNLRQLGFAAEIYSQNFWGYFPHEDAGSGGSPPQNCAWYDLLPLFLDCANPNDVEQCPSVDAEDNWHTFKMNSLLENADVLFYRRGSTRGESETIFLFDGRVDNSGVRYQVKGTWNSAALRHHSTTNLLFLDLHVKNYRAEPDDAGWANEGPFIWDPY